MAPEERQAFYYITREEFVRRMEKTLRAQMTLKNRYKKALVGTVKDSEEYYLFTEEVQHLIDGIKYNKRMIERTKVEYGFNLFFVDHQGDVFVKRCTKEEHDAIYMPRRQDYVI